MKKKLRFSLKNKSLKKFLVVGIGCSAGAAFYAMSPSGKMRIRNFQRKARTKLARINKQYKPKIVDGVEKTKLPLQIKMRKKFYEKAIKPVPISMQKSLKMLVGDNYQQGFKMA